MKKIALYILILIALTGIFGSGEIIYSQTPGTAQCFTKDGVAIALSVIGSPTLCKSPNVWKIYTVPPAPTPNPTPSPTNPEPTNTKYELLEPLPGMEKIFDTKSEGALGKYLNIIINLVIGISAVLAVVMIVMGGIEYMGSELISSKEAGKERIQNAILGLLIALGAYALLNTINPDLLNSDIKIDQATVTVNLGGESTSIPFKPIEKGSLAGLGINCPGTGGKGSTANIGQQFIGKSTYSQERRNTVSTSTVYLDCSSFAAQVYACAGVGNPGGTTESMFTKPTAQRINGATFNYASLAPGTLIGWRPSDDKYGNGHVMIYMGNGKVLHATSTSNVTISNLSEYQARVTYVVS